METQLRLITKGALYLVLITPLIITSSMFFPYITGKNIFFRVLIAIAALAVAALMWQRKIVVERSPIFIAFGIFVVVMLLAAFFGVNIEKSLWSNFERMEGWVTTALLCAYLLALVHTFKTDAEWKKYLAASLTMSVVIALMGLFELRDISRVDASLGNSTYLGVYALFHIWIAGYLKLDRFNELGGSFKRALHDTKIWVFGLAGLLNIVVMYFTLTRSAFLGLLAGLIVAAIIFAVALPRGNRIKKVSIGFLLLILVSIPAFFALRNASFVEDSALLSRFANISLEDATTRSRVLLWGIGLDAAKERPLLGWGQDNFIQAFSEHYDVRMLDQEDWFDRAHNVFFDWLTQGGILGLLAYLGIFAAAFVMLYRARDVSIYTRALFAGLLASYLVNNFFVFDNITSYILLVTILGFIAHLTRSQASEKNLSDMQAKALAVALIVIALFGFYTAIQSMQNGGEMIRGLSAARAGQLDIAKESFENVIARGGVGKQEAVEQFGISLQPSALQNASEEERSAYIQASIGAMTTYLESDPDNPRVNLILAGVYSRLGMNEEALQQYERTLEIMPDKQEVRLGKAETLFALERKDEAFSIIEEMYEETPHFREIQVAYILGLLKLDRDEEALTLLDEISEDQVIDNNALIDLLSQKGHMEYVVDVFEKRVKENPDDPQLRLMFALAFYKAGERGRATQVMQQIMKDFPEVADEAEKILIDMVEGDLKLAE